MASRLILRALVAGWIGGFAGNAFLGAMFSNRWVREILYDPALQSQIFILLTPQRDIARSVIGLIVLSGLHGVLFVVLRPAIPGDSWVRKGVWWGGTIWAIYWLFQEWFIYITLLDEPVSLAALELAILFLGSLLEGVVISRLLVQHKGR